MNELLKKVDRTVDTFQDRGGLGVALSMNRRTYEEWKEQMSEIPLFDLITKPWNGGKVETYMGMIVVIDDALKYGETKPLDAPGKWWAQ